MAWAGSFSCATGRPKTEAVRRENERGNRYSGLVDTQFDIVHSHGFYDLEVDTAANTPAECANFIQDLLNEKKEPEALKLLKSSLT